MAIVDNTLPSAPLFTPAGAIAAAAEREEMAEAGLAAFRRLTGLWALSNEEAAALLDVTERTWSRMKKPGWTGRVSQDQLLRLSALVGLYKALHLYFSDTLADRWPGRPNTGPLFKGASPVAFMLSGGLPAIMQTRDYVDALRGGV
jgi:hypothetical protein